MDEAGRGPLAGPVVAAAVILDPARPMAGLRDSKQLSAARRERLAAEIRERALAWALGWSDAQEIDVLDVLQASLLAMRRALLGLAIAPARVLIDGRHCPSPWLPGDACRIQAVVRGDARVAEISAASILAKVSRDAWMERAAPVYPGYGFERHKGYPTSLHLAGLSRHGPCRLHRRSFAPVRSAHGTG
ncbi:MAG TPA: ribonuclease HII [Steroidobacteraceae bacterium]|nr:ribonuclease HII [Steroidobacteraceae bacterium]